MPRPGIRPAGYGYMFADGYSRPSPADPAVARLSAYPMRVRMESPRIVVQRQTLF